MRTSTLHRTLVIGLLAAASACGGAANGGNAAEAPAVGRQTPPEHDELVIPVSDEDPQWGDHDAPVTFVQFADLECPFSAKLQHVIRDLQTKYGPEKLRIVWKNYPLSFHENALPAHERAMAIFEKEGEEAFFSFQQKVFGHQKALDTEVEAVWAEESGVPREELRLLLESGNPQKKVAEDMELARSLGLTGTPVVFINGRRINGAQPPNVFQAAIDGELSAAALLVDKGYTPHDVYPLRVAENFTQKADEAKKDAAADLTVWKIPVTHEEPILGDDRALVTLVMFADLQCPYSKRVQSTVQALRQKYSDEIRVIWKDHPLPFHPEALPAARVAGYIFQKRGNEAFWKAKDALFGEQKDLGTALYAKVLTAAGLSWEEFEAADLTEVDATLAANSKLAADFSVKGTPTFFINGRRLVGSQPAETFQKLIDEQMSKASKLVEGGVPPEEVYDRLMKDASSAVESAP